MIIVFALNTVGCLIPSFSRNTTIMVINNEVYINVSINYTAMGSELQLFCGNETNEKSASPVFTAICGESGTWSPDLSGHNCAMDQGSNDCEFNIALWFAQTLHCSYFVPMHAMREISWN